MHGISTKAKATIALYTRAKKVCSEVRANSFTNLCVHTHISTLQLHLLLACNFGCNQATACGGNGYDAQVAQHPVNMLKS